MLLADPVAVDLNALPENRRVQYALDMIRVGDALLAQMPKLAHLEPGMGVHLFTAVPMSLQRVANVERAQMLLESPSRMALQKIDRKSVV